MGHGSHFSVPRHTSTPFCALGHTDDDCTYSSLGHIFSWFTLYKLIFPRKENSFGVLFESPSSSLFLGWFLSSFTKKNFDFQTKFRFDPTVWQEIGDSPCCYTLKVKNPLYFRCETRKCSSVEDSNLVLIKTLHCALNSRLTSCLCILFLGFSFHPGEQIPTSTVFIFQNRLPSN